MENKNICDCDCIHYDQTKLAKNALGGFAYSKALAIFYKTFADETRLKILCVLDSVGRMCVCDIAVALNMTMSAISHQLRYLKESKLIKSEKCGKEVFYTLADEHIKGVFELGLEHVQEKANEKRI